MAKGRHNAFQRLFRGETSFDFCGRWRQWFAISAVVIIVGLVSLATRGLNFSIDFKGGTVWEVPSSATVSEARSAVEAAVPGFGQSTIVILTNTQTHQRTVKVEAPAKLTGDSSKVSAVTDGLAKMAGVSPNDVQLDDVGPSWGSDITNKAVRAVIIFLVVVTGYIWLRFEGKMALAALVALVHDILVTLGIYSLSGFEVSPDTVIAFLTILGYSLYDTIVVFDKVQENTRGLASTNRLTYSDTVNLSMNQVLARSLNTSLVAIMPILSILVIGAWVLGATALEDFGLALFIGLTTGAYSSIFIASPLLALLKEREPRYAEIRRRLATSGSAGGRRITPLAAATGDLSGALVVRSARTRSSRASDGNDRKAVNTERQNGASVTGPTAVGPGGTGPGGTGSGGTGSGGTGSSVADPVAADLTPDSPDGSPTGAASTGAASTGAASTSTTPASGGTRPPPRPRKKGRRR
jgi:preprotein translocase subunit SecF